MKKYLLLLILLPIVAYANIGQITVLRGDVTITRDDKIIKAKSGVSLKKYDYIKTADNAKVQIVFLDKTIFTIGKNSTLDIAEYLYDESKPLKNKAKFNVFKGAFTSITGRIGKLNKNKFKLKTKSATIGIRGTIVKANQETIMCTEGGITVTTLNGVSVNVEAGSKTLVSSGTPSTPTAIKPNDEKSLDADVTEEDKKESKAQAKSEKKKETKTTSDKSTKNEGQSNKGVKKEQSQENSSVTSISSENLVSNISVDVPIVKKVATAGVITIDNVTSDNIINKEESSSLITLTGSVKGGDTSVGDSVTITIDNKSYSTTVTADGTWSLDVEGSDLKDDTSFDIHVISSNADGNIVTSSAQKAFEVDTVANIGNIFVNDITDDNIIDAVESSSTVSISGSASGGEISSGDIVTMTINGSEYTATIQDDNTWLVNVDGSDLKEDNDFEIQINSSDSAGNFIISSVSPTYSIDMSIVKNALTTAINSPITIENAITKPLVFDGDGDYLLVSNKLNDVLGQNRTEFMIDVILNPTVLTENQSNHKVKNVFFAKAADISNDNLEIGIDTSGKLIVYIDTNGADTTAIFGNDGDIQIGQDNEIIVKYKDGEVTVSINGNIYTDSKTWNSSKTQLDNADNSDVTIGATLHQDTYFTGTMSSLKIYSDFEGENLKASYLFTGDNALQDLIGNNDALSVGDTHRVLSSLGLKTESTIEKKGFSVHSSGIVNKDFTTNESEELTSWGYWNEEETGYKTAWVSGVVTDTEVLDKLRTSELTTTAYYKGQVIGNVNGNDNILLNDYNQVNFKFDLGGGQNNFTGDMKFQTKTQNWDSSFGGVTNANTFSTTSLSGTGNGAPLTSGSIQGNFYGKTTIVGTELPSEVGGTFSLGNGKDTANGVFLAH